MRLGPIYNTLLDQLEVSGLKIDPGSRIAALQLLGELDANGLLAGEDGAKRVADYLRPVLVRDQSDPERYEPTVASWVNGIAGTSSPVTPEDPPPDRPRWVLIVLGLLLTMVAGIFLAIWLSAELPVPPQVCSNPTSPLCKIETLPVAGGVGIPEICETCLPQDIESNALIEAKRRELTEIVYEIVAPTIRELHGRGFFGSRSLEETAYNIALPVDQPLLLHAGGDAVARIIKAAVTEYANGPAAISSLDANADISLVGGAPELSEGRPIWWVDYSPSQFFNLFYSATGIGYEQLPSRHSSSGEYVTRRWNGLIYSGFADGRVTFYDVNTNEESTTLLSGSGAIMTDVVAVDVGADESRNGGSAVLIASYDDGTLKPYDLPNASTLLDNPDKETVIVFSEPLPQKVHLNPISELVLSSDNRRLASISADGVVNIWNFPSMISEEFQQLSNAEKVFDLDLGSNRLLYLSNDGIVMLAGYGLTQAFQTGDAILGEQKSIDDQSNVSSMRRVSANKNWAGFSPLTANIVATTERGLGVFSNAGQYYYWITLNENIGSLADCHFGHKDPIFGCIFESGNMAFWDTQTWEPINVDLFWDGKNPEILNIEGGTDDLEALSIVLAGSDGAVFSTSTKPIRDAQTWIADFEAAQLSSEDLGINIISEYMFSSDPSEKEIGEAAFLRYMSAAAFTQGQTLNIVNAPWLENPVALPPSRPWLEHLQTWLPTYAAALCMFVGVLAWLIKAFTAATYLGRSKPEDVSRVVEYLLDMREREEPSDRVLRDAARHMLERENSVSRFAIDSTIEAVTRSAGFCVPVFTPTRRKPGYVFLIDQLSVEDHGAGRVRDYMKRLRTEGVPIEDYYFSGSPADIRKTPTGLSNPLRSILEQSFDRKLVVFGDAAKIMSPLARNASDWSELLKMFPARAFLTSIPVPEWGIEENHLALEMEMGIAPLSAEGFKLLPQTFRAARSGANRRLLDHGSLELDAQPAFIRRQERRLALDLPPSDKDIRKIMAEFYIVFDKDAARWLYACALFPLLQWDLTVELGLQLKDEAGQPVFTERRLAQISDLIWMRRGYIPDWLRVEMVKRIRDSDKAVLKAFFAQLFEGNAEEKEIRKDDATLLIDSMRGEATNGDEIFMTFVREKSSEDDIKTHKSLRKRVKPRARPPFFRMDVLQPLILSTSIAFLAYMIVPSDPTPSLNLSSWFGAAFILLSVCVLLILPIISWFLKTVLLSLNWALRSARPQAKVRQRLQSA